MDRELVLGMAKALREFDADAEVRAIVMLGETPGFCAGSDLKFIGGISLEEMCRFEAETGEMARLIGFLKKPVVAAVEGFAFGGGFILAVSCDIIITASNARWHLPEVPIGWLTPWGIQALIARVGPVAARKLCFATEVLDGHEALRLGLVDHVVDEGNAMESAMAQAQRLAALPFEAAVATKRLYAAGIMKSAEVADIQANLAFAENCLHPIARATLERFAATARQS
jgi:enoyl-CoA hydratase/carnithine racemase